MLLISKSQPGCGWLFIFKIRLEEQEVAVAFQAATVFAWVVDFVEAGAADFVEAFFDYFEAAAAGFDSFVV